MRRKNDGQAVPAGGSSSCGRAFTLATGARRDGSSITRHSARCGGADYGPIANIQPNIVTPTGRLCSGRRYVRRRGAGKGVAKEASGRGPSSRSLRHRVALETDRIEGAIRFCDLADRRGVRQSTVVETAREVGLEVPLRSMRCVDRR